MGSVIQVNRLEQLDRFHDTEPAASALGMTPQALIIALKSAQTISSLAAAKGLTVASLESILSPASSASSRRSRQTIG